MTAFGKYWVDLINHTIAKYPQVSSSGKPLNDVLLKITESESEIDVNVFESFILYSYNKFLNIHQGVAADFR